MKMILNNRKVLEGEAQIYLSEEIYKGYKNIYLEPYPKVNPKVIHEIMNADLVVLGPGGFYTSIIPNLLVEGVAKALKESPAKKVFVVNLMNRKGQCTSNKVSDNLKELIKFLDEDIFEYILVNKQEPSKELIDNYSDEGDLVQIDLEDERMIKADLLGPIAEVAKKDLIRRSLIRHDSRKLAKEIFKIVNNI